MLLTHFNITYIKNGSFTGFEVELMYLFCEAYGYRPVFESAQWTSGVAGLKEGKYDVVSCGIYMTEERRESVNFCDPYVTADVIMVTYRSEAEAGGFWASLEESFEKTFIREERWKLIGQGVLVTMLISLCAVLGGTIFGFGIYMLARSKYRAIAGATRTVARICARLLAGTPTLVVLMILFYIVFSDWDGMVVAIVCFALSLGFFVYSHLTLCVEGVDRGQMEAAYALGYTRNKGFFDIILPQAMRTFLPTYTGEVVGLIKATSAVGYVAVSDLTKMGDIIRSNTYEALFPLVAVAVIYFMITWGAAALLGMVQKKMDLRRHDVCGRAVCRHTTASAAGNHCPRQPQARLMRIIRKCSHMANGPASKETGPFVFKNVFVCRQFRWRAGTDKN